MEVLFELVLEFVLWLVLEIGVNVGLHAVVAPFRREAGPWLSALGYALIGAVLGLASLWIWPHHLVGSPVLRVVNLVLSPLLAGACMAALGRWRERRGQALLRIDRFAYGALLALGLALARYLGAA